MRESSENGSGKHEINGRKKREGDVPRGSDSWTLRRRCRVALPHDRIVFQDHREKTGKISLDQNGKCWRRLRGKKHLLHLVVYLQERKRKSSHLKRGHKVSSNRPELLNSILL